MQHITTSSRHILLSENPLPHFQETDGKIYRYIPHFLHSVMSGNFFSSKQFYQCVQVTLMSASLLGVVGSVGLLAIGMAGVSLLTMALSMTTATGAYIAHQASLQQTFVENALEIRQQVEIFSNQNETLKKTTEALKEQNIQLELQYENYKSLELQLQSDIKRLQASNEKNIETFTNRIKEFSEQISASRDLWGQLAKEKALHNQEQTNQLTSLKQILKEITDPKKTLLQLQEHRKINQQIQEAVIELKKIQQQLTDLGHQVSVKEGQIKERDNLLASLQEKHQKILSLYEQLSKNFEKQNMSFQSGNKTFATHIKELSQISATISPTLPIL